MSESPHISPERVAKEDADRRSRQYMLAGNVFAALMFVGFTAFLARNYFQNTLWKDFYYKNAFKFGDSCSARFDGSDSADFPTSLQSKKLTKIEQLPHRRGFFDSWHDGHSPFYHAEYLCKFETSSVRIGKGVNYLHLGWLFGQRIEIAVHDQVILETLADDFISIPVAQRDLARPEFSLRVRVSSPDRHRFGFASILPPVLTTETKDHLSALAIQPIYEMVNVVQPLIPTIILGMLIAFTWLIGIRTRIVLTGLFYFACELGVGGLALFGPYMPISAVKVFVLGLPVTYLTHIAVICLMLEVFGLLRTRIYLIMKGGSLLAAVAIVLLLAWDGVFPYSQQVSKCLDPVFLLLFAAVGISGYRVRAKESSRQKQNLQTASLFLITALLYRFGHEVSRHFSWTSYVSIDFYFHFALPLYLSGIVLYYLSAMEEDLRQTKMEKKKLLDRITVGSDLLSIVRTTSAPVSSEYVELKWPDGVDNVNDWRLSWMTSTGSVMVIEGVLIGGGEQSSLGSVAIYAVLEQCRQKKIDDPEQCLKQINETLVNLFKGFVRAEATALLVRSDLRTEIVSANGRTIALSNGETHHPGGDQLGVSERVGLQRWSIRLESKMVLTFVDERKRSTSSRSEISIVAA